MYQRIINQSSQYQLLISTKSVLTYKFQIVFVKKPILSSYYEISFFLMIVKIQNFLHQRVKLLNDVPVVRGAGLVELIVSRGEVRFTLEPPRGALLPPLPIGSPPRIASASYGSAPE